MNWLVMASVISLMPISAHAGILDSLLCSQDITSEMKGKFEAKGNVRAGWVDAELTNNSLVFSISSVSVRIEGQYNSRQFRREYPDQEIQVKPGLSARLLFDTGLGYDSKIRIDKFRITKFTGCE